MRELVQIAERRMLAARRGRGSVREAIDGGGARATEASSLKEQLESFERAILAEALTQVEGSMDEVAEHLGIARRTLNEKLAKYDLKRR